MRRILRNKKLKKFSGFHILKQKKAGFSIISLLVAIGVLGLILSGVMESLKNNMKAHKKFEELSDMVDIRRVIRARVNCAATKTANGNNWTLCNGSTKIKAVDQSNATVISETNPATTYGPYTLELTCTMSGGTASLRLDVKKSGTLTYPNIFKKVPFTCP